ncbi:hypothetical protein POJ06DRAFT_279123 [Lipomyces tetrasporus]|uniref:Uncharacterized protein n=1 Tax=Lipomyces tetrasporus TaxID=54092 RepID=A0AAD7QK41_9ASCO|nr:uncharacterized protein POJ06DRAFT_279123 [Lipomyces tetrasporus]KAJ8096513.1 hypothetical protein POJ06DRAFT_279123 [Lipomyces tetrasporus]
MSATDCVTEVEVIDLHLSDIMSPEHISLFLSGGDEASIAFHLDGQELVHFCNSAIQNTALGRLNCYGET